MHLQQTESFRRAAGLIVADAQATPSLEDRKLNLALLLEEVSELAEAYGLRNWFGQEREMGAYSDKSGKHAMRDTREYNPVEALDALADIQVILDGAVLTSGLQHVMEPALTEVFNSNNSKVDLTEEEATMEATAYRYAVVCRVPTMGWVIRRSTDGKLLKPSTFIAPNLSQFIQS